MNIKVELHRDVVWFLRNKCNDMEVDAFYKQLEKIQSDFIKHSEAISDPKISRYMLRFFRFKNCIAIFESNRALDKLRIRLCRRIPPKRNDRKKPRDEV